MNQQQHYMDSHQSQISAGQSYAHPSTTSGIPQYPHYQQQQVQQSILQPAPGHYASTQGSYGPPYGYPNGLASPQGPGQPVSSSMGQQMNTGLPSIPSGPPQHLYAGPPSGPPAGYQQQSPDQTGQVAPSGMKPRVTATLWEDEGCMCFQVETKGICVARRDDNHMINGTKLLNVAGMTRGRRDGILKSEKTRHVVKIGPMHLKGVWIPFERALDFANKEKTTELLYPLFVHNIGALLYHPTNQSRTNAVMAAADKRKLDIGKQQGGMMGSQIPQSPSLHHHHSMNSSIGSSQSHSIAPHPAAGRPGIDRAHTFPTPPTSASGTIAGLGQQGNGYDWGGQAMAGGVHGAQPLMIESHAHSTPATPATTPPGAPLPSLHPYQSNQSYETARPMYSGATQQQPQYAPQHSLQQQGMTARGPLASSSYMKQEMGPPTGRAPGSRPESEHGDAKIDAYAHSQGNEQVGHGTGEEEAEHEHEHDADYAHDANHAYAALRGPFGTYSSGQPPTGPLNGDHAQIPTDMNGSSSHQNGSGRTTPRNSSGSQSQWAAGHQTPPRAPPSSNLYNPMSDTRGSLPNGNSGAEAYVPGAYAPSQTNGVIPSTKRMRDDEDHSRPASRTEDIDTMKRRKMSRETSSNGAVINGSFENDGRTPNRARSNLTPRARR